MVLPLKAVSFLGTVFPDVTLGQIVRGIGQEHWIRAFTGVPDMRGMIMAMNVILVLEAAKSCIGTLRWMQMWLGQCTGWLGSNLITKK